MGFIERIKSALGLGTSTSSPGSTSSANRGADDESGAGGEPTPVSEIEGDDEVEVAQTVVDPGDRGTDDVDPGDRGTDDVDVTVEHEPDTRSEDAVKGTDTAGTGTSADIEPAEAATGESSTETGVDADETGTEVDTTETDAESAGDTTGQSTDTDADTDTTSQSADTDAETGTTGPSADPDTDTEVPAADLEELKGIGPAYAGRLREAGIEDVAALAAADAADLAERTDIAEGRLQTFVERAAEK